MTFIADVAKPVTIASSRAAWLVAPAVSESGVAWIEIDRRRGWPWTAAAFSGDRLLLRTKGRPRTIADEACDARAACETIRAPVATTEGRFVYALALGGGAGTVALLDPSGSSRVLADTSAEGLPGPVAATDRAAFWVEDGAIMRRPFAEGDAEVFIAAERVGGVVVDLAAAGVSIAWSVRRPDRSVAVYQRIGGGDILERATATARSRIAFGALAVAADGTVIVAERRPERGRRVRVVVRALRPDGTATVLGASQRIPRGDPAEAMRPAADGMLVAFRLRTGPRADREEVRLHDLATGTAKTVVRQERWKGRLSDPGLGGGRLVWTRTNVRVNALVRSRLYSARLKAADATRSATRTG